MKKLFLFIIILTLSAGLWAQDSAITYTATAALPASDDEFDSPINLHTWSSYPSIFVEDKTVGKSEAFGTMGEKQKRPCPHRY